MAESTVESVTEVSLEQMEKRPIRVLHVDDEPNFLKSAKQCLEIQGAFEVETASSVEEATEKLKKKTYDAIVCDYVMAGKDGLEFLKALRDRGNNIPFVIFTGKGREEVAIKALNLGADRYFNKIGPPEAVYGELAHGIRRVVEERKAQMEIWRREERLRAILSSSPDAIIISDLNANVVDCNQATLKLTGCASKEKIIGKNSLEFIAEKDRNRALQNLKKTFEQETVGSIEYTLLKKDGEEYQGELSASVLRDASGNQIGFVGVVRDITERKKVEEALRASEEKLRNIFQSANDCIFYLDKSGRIIDVNQKAVKLFGRSKNELFGRHFAKVGAISPKDLPTIMKAFAQSLAGKQDTLDVYIRDKSGQGIPLECSSSLVKMDGETTGVLVIARDITERKKAGEEELKKAEERYRGLMEETPIGILHVDFKGKLTYVNKKLEEILGYSKNEIIGKNWFDLCHKQRLMSEESIKMVSKRMKNKFMDRDAPPMTFPLKRKDGSLIWVEGYSKLLNQFGVPVGLQATLKDITEQKKAEEVLRESEAKYRQLFELAPDGIITVNTKGVIESVNDAFLKLTGYSQDEIVGIHFTKLGTLRARDIPKYLKMMSAVMRGKIPEPFEYSYVRKDGTIGWGDAHVGLMKRDGKTTGFQVLLREITGRKMAERATQESEEKFERLFLDNPEPAIYTDSKFHLLDVNPRFKELFGYSLDEIKGKHIDDVVVPKDKIKEAEMLNKKAKKGYVYHDTVRKKKDGSLVPVSISAAPITVEDRLIGYVAVYKDISQLKETLEKLETMNEKLRVVGKLTRHDARNKLSTVTMNTFLAKQKLTENHKALQHLSEVESAVGQVERIFDFARIYEKLGMEELTYMDVKKNLEESASLFSDLKNIKVVNDCRGLTVLADSLLRQLFYNLIDNSLKHGEKASQIRAYYEAGKDQLKLVYEDDGVGIPKTDKDKIFEEGYGKGTGYGLYLIRKMCEVYGWNIQETGRQDKGAQFTITIPKMNEKGKMNYVLSN